MSLSLISYVKKPTFLPSFSTNIPTFYVLSSYLPNAPEIFCARSRAPMLCSVWSDTFCAEQHIHFKDLQLFVYMPVLHSLYCKLFESFYLQCLHPRLVHTVSSKTVVVNQGQFSSREMLANVWTHCHEWGKATGIQQVAARVINILQCTRQFPIIMIQSVNGARI